MRLLTLIATAITTFPLIGNAQSRADLGAGLISSENKPPEMRLSPSLQVLRPSGFLKVDASLGDFTQRVRLQSSTFDAAVRSGSIGPLRFSLDASAISDSSKGLSPRAEAGLAGSMRLGTGGGYTRASHDADGQTGIHFSAWKAFRTAIVSVTRSYSDERLPLVTQRLNLVTVAWAQSSGDSAAPASGRSTSPGRDEGRPRSWSETQARVDMSAGRLMMSAVFGARATVESDTIRSAMKWGRLTLGARVNSMFSLVGSAGWVPVSARPLSQASRFIELGVRFSPGLLLRDPLRIPIRPAATSFNVIASGDRTYRIRFVVPGARTVEMSGDFNEWKAISLVEVSPHVWQASLPLEPGVHRVSVRVNGEKWTAPPGVPSVEDEFTGNRVGILVVK